MTFKERCDRFQKNTEKEKNIYRYITRVIFLNKKKEEQLEEEKLFFTETKKENRPKSKKWNKEKLEEKNNE